MDYTYLPLTGSLIGTATLTLISLYLYISYRKTYMGLWVLSWLIFFCKYAFLDSELYSWKHSPLGLTLYQLLILSAVLLFIVSIYNFTNRPFNKCWIYAIGMVVIISTILNFQQIPSAYKLLLPIYTCCASGIWIGYNFIYRSDLQSLGAKITGYGYLSLSLLNLLAPFGMYNQKLLPWGYISGGILRIIIAIGTLILYFEKTRKIVDEKKIQNRQLAENSLDVIYQFQLVPNFRIQYISASVSKVTGYTPAEYYNNNKLICTIIHPEDHIPFKNFIDNLPHSTNTLLTIRLIKKDKTICWVEQTCIPVYNEIGSFISLEGSVRDITYRKKLEQLSFDQMSMVGNMAVTVAHQIRNPMTTIRGYLQLLERKKHYQADIEKIQFMIEQVDKANDIITQYLSLSHQKVSSLKHHSLNDLITVLFPLLQANANSSNITILLKLNAIPKMMLDQNEIRQLLLNLIKNGMEAMPTGGNLTITTTVEENTITLSVQDQGMGIAPHILKQLGNPFLTTKAARPGLGLSICYQIAHRHNAIIKVSTSSKGTIFFVHFPRTISVTASATLDTTQ